MNKTRFPRQYWYYWPLLGLLWLLAQLPFPLLMRFGRQVGWLLYKIPNRTRHVSQVNLLHCFPTLSATEQRHLLYQSLMSAGMGMMESLICWLGNPERHQHRLQMQTPESVLQALARGKGVIFLCPHMTCLHLAGALVAQKQNFAVVYNKLKHPLIETINLLHLQRYYQHAIPREKIRSAIRILQQNKSLFYTPDIDPVAHGGVFAPFFGVMAYSLTATAKLVSLTGAAVVPVHFFRNSDYSGYTVHFASALTDFPSGDAVADATRINQAMEAIIKQHPEQYMWPYKRFKTRPPGEMDFYAATH